VDHYHYVLTVGYYSRVRDTERHLENARSSLNRIAQDIGARPEILIFGARDWMVERFAKLSELLAVLHETANVDWRRDELPFIYEHILPMLHSGARALIYLVVAYRPDYFGMPISQLTFLETAVQGVFTSISNLKHSLSHALIHDLFRIRNLFECMDMKSKVSVPQNPVSYISHPYGMKIEVKDLTFRYKKDSAPVLKNVNFTIERGQMVSIVGYNGSGSNSYVHARLNVGKTTLIRLLTLLEHPSSGSIYVNDIDVSEYEPQALRTNMSILFQEFRMSNSRYTNARKISGNICAR
jgi:ATP-binding cassette, subfamily B, bacterial